MLTERVMPWPTTLKDSQQSKPDFPFQIAVRTYLLSLSISLGPDIIPLLVSQTSQKHHRHALPPGAFFRSLNRVLERELAFDGFAFSMTFAIAGGALLKRYWRVLTWNNLLDDVVDPRSVIKDSRGNNDGDNRHTTAPRFAKIRVWLARRFRRANISAEQETFISYVLSSTIGVWLLQAGSRRNFSLRQRSGRPSPNQSPTLDLALLLLVRAVDSFVQTLITQRSPSLPLLLSDRGKEEVTANDGQILTDADPKSATMKENKRGKDIRQRFVSHLDAIVFWACSARIMWCFFYEPHRLHTAYVTWIQRLANLDPRIVEVLRLRRANKWTYQTGSSSESSFLEETCKELGYPPSWGNPTVVPAYGGQNANKVWNNLGVKGRKAVGGVPCEVLHYLPSILGKAGENSVAAELKRSCTANAVLRMGKGFLDAMAIYLPVHILPVLLTNPQALLRPHRILQTVLGSIRSSAFLSTFIALFWFSVCCARTLLFAKLLPFISHNFWDGPLGGIMAGCLTCGCSIWIENGRRRGEMALYVLPKALRTCFPNGWLRHTNRWGFKFVESVTFVLSLATLLTAATHRPESLRGLSRWALTFIMNEPNTVWKRRRRDPSGPPTPCIAPSPIQQGGSSGSMVHG